MQGGLFICKRQDVFPVLVILKDVSAAWGKSQETGAFMEPFLFRYSHWSSELWLKIPSTKYRKRRGEATLCRKRCAGPRANLERDFGSRGGCVLPMTKGGELKPSDL